MPPENNKSPKGLKFHLNVKDGTFDFEGDKTDLLEVLDKLSQLGFNSQGSSNQFSSSRSPSQLPKAPSGSHQPSSQDSLTKFEQIKLLIKDLNGSSRPWFTSKDILDLFDGDISPSTVSTYLSRLESKGILQRRGTKKDLEYQLISDDLEVESLPDNLQKRTTHRHNK